MTLPAVARRSEAGLPLLRHRWETLLWIAVLAQLVAVVAWPHPVTVDGPAHLLGATVLAHYGDPLYSRLYHIDLFPSPNLLIEFVQAALVRVASLEVAEKFVIGAYVVLLPLGLWYAIRGVRPSSGWLAVAALPLTFNYLFFYGFFNFCLGMALSLFTVGYALRHRHAWSPRSTVVLAGLLLLGYFTHLVPYALALLFVAAQAATVAVSDLRERWSGRLWPVLLRRFGPPTLAAAPGLALTAAFLLHTQEGEPPTWRPLPELLSGLLTLIMPIVTFGPAEAPVAGAVAATLAVLAFVAVRRRGWEAVRDGAAPLLAALLATGLFFAAPNRFGVDYGLISERISFFPVFFFVLWLAAQPPVDRARRWVSAILVLAAVALAVIRVPALVHYDRLIAEYETVTHVVRPGSTLLAVRFTELEPPGGSVRNPHWDPMRHMAGRVAAATHGVNVGHYEAVLDYFPTRFRDDANLRLMVDPTLSGLEEAPPRIDISSAERGGRPLIDYVLVVSPEAGDLRDPRVAGVLADLRRDYRCVAVTRPSGLVQVWAAAPGPGPGAGHGPGCERAVTR